MPGFFDRIFLNNSIRDYGIVLSIIFIAWIFKKFVGGYVAKGIFLIMKQFGKLIDKSAFSALVLGPIETFLFLLISFIALHSLNFPQIFYLKFYKTDTKNVLDTIGTAIIILTFFWMLLRVIDYMAMVMERRANLTPGQSDNQLVIFFKDFLKAILVIIGLLMLLRFAFDYNITKILAGLSLAGAAIALAARESLENLIASFIIFFDKPFATGDLLKVNNITGTVERIGLRSTRIRTTEKTYVTVPNKQMVDSIVDNLSLRTQRRGELKLELDLNTESPAIEAVLQGLGSILNDSNIEQKTVMLGDITQQAFLIQCEYFTSAISIQEFNILKEKINLETIRLLEKLGIEIAGTNRDVRILKNVE